MTKLYSIKGLQALLICLSLLVSSSIQAQVPSYVPTDGLVGYWPFNGNANDESGNGNDGTVNGATLTADRNGLIDAAYSFTTNQKISTSMALSSSFSVGFWINLNSYESGGSSCSNSSAFISHKNNADFGNGFFIGQTSGSWNWGVYNGASNSIQDFPSGIDLSNWYFVVETADGFGNFNFYINGQNLSQQNAQNAIIQSGEVYDFSIGNWNDGGTTCWCNGVIDDVCYWNRALTEDEIQALYTGCNVAPTTIAGSVNPFTLTSSDYACNNNPGSTYEWTITNGVITAGQGTSNVTVLWGEEGAGTLTVVETNTEGCSGTPATIEVTIECATTATTLDGPLGPNALTETTYTCNGSANSTFEWTISNGVITSGQGTNSVTVLWAATGLGSISVQETTNANCLGDLISIDVVVIPTSIDELNESNLFLYPNPAKEEITLQTNQSSIGSLYIIVDQTGKQIATGKITGTNTTIKLDQFASGMYTIIRDGKTSQQFQVIK